MTFLSKHAVGGVSPAADHQAGGVLESMRSRSRARATIVAAVLTLAGTGTLTVVPAQASDSSSSNQKGTITVTPTQVVAGSVTEFTVRVKYDSGVLDRNGNSKTIGEIDVAIPKGAPTFTNRSVVTGSLVVDSKNVESKWSVKVGEEKLEFDKVNDASKLKVGGYVEAKVRMTAPSLPSTPTSQVWKASGSEDLSFASQPTVSWVKGTQTITFDQPADRTWGDASAPVSATTDGGSGEPVVMAVKANSGSTCTIDSNRIVTATAAGPCTLVASQAGNNNWNAATSVERTFQVNKADQAINFGALSDVKYASGATVTFPAAGGGDSGNSVTYAVTPHVDTDGVTHPSKCSLSGRTLSLTGAGFCAVTASQEGSANFNAAPSVTRFFQVSKGDAQLTLDLETQNAEYDGTAKAVTVTTTPGGLSGVTVTYSKGDVPVTNPTDAGTYLVEATLTHEDFAAPQSVVGQLVIEAKAITGGFRVGDKTYDGNADATITGTSLVGKVRGDDVSLSHADASASFDDKNAGTKTVTGSGFTLSGAKAGNYLLGDVTNTAGGTITAKRVTGAITGSDREYDGTTAASASAVDPIDGEVLGDDLTLTAGAATFDSAEPGARTITAPISLSRTDASNYSLTSNTASVAAMINKVSRTVAISNLPAEGQAGQGFTPTVTPSLGAGDGTTSVTSTSTDICTVGTNSAVSFVAAGTCILEAAVTAGTHHAAATGAAQSIAVAAAPVVTAPVWTNSGYLSPVDMNTSTKKFLNVVKAGSAVPLKFRVTKDGEPVTVTTGMTFAVKGIMCDTGATADQLGDLSTGSTALRYDTASGQFIQNWKTPTILGCYAANVTLPNGDVITADFRINK